MAEQMNQLQMSQLTDDQIDRMVAERLEPTPIRGSNIWIFEPAKSFTRDWSACGMLLEQLVELTHFKCTATNQTHGHKN